MGLCAAYPAKRRIVPRVAIATTPSASRARSSPPVHRLARVLVKMPDDHPARRVRALRLERAGAARPAGVFLRLFRQRRLEQAQCLVSRAAPGVALTVVAEPVPAEVFAPL